MNDKAATDAWRMADLLDGADCCCSLWRRWPVASGSTSKSITCTGAFQTVKLSVTSQNRAFLGGTAYAKAELSAWPHSATHEGEIKISW